MNTNIPDKKRVESAVRKLFRVLFPFNDKIISPSIDFSGTGIRDRFETIFRELETDYQKVNEQFFSGLPEIKNALSKDAQFILESDPAARDLVEVMTVYPGFFAIYCYRIAHSIGQLSVHLLPRMVTEYAHKLTGIDIHPGATIGIPLSIDHGTGIVIGETTEIGNNVKLYQGVTLGALSVDKSKALKKRHPTIGDNVIIYAGSTILGGETVVGSNSVIGGNVWLTESVAPFSVVYHKSEVIVRDSGKFQEPINFII